MKINIHNQTDHDIRRYTKIIKRIFRHIKSKENMQLIFTTPEHIQTLNQTYRNIDRPTDVLSFTNDDQTDKSLGDVFINIDQALLQANELGHSDEREVGFLAVHGFLHLLGYDHHNEIDEEKMNYEQERILGKAKLKRGR